ncbi:hypothetical protein HDU83_003704 [Entophlyctis luteolus]|nr:hypothetical protein HDU83_003704 [Entophlyctis luteolus]
MQVAVHGMAASPPPLLWRGIRRLSASLQAGSGTGAGSVRGSDSDSDSDQSDDADLASPASSYASDAPLSIGLLYPRVWSDHRRQRHRVARLSRHGQQSHRLRPQPPATVYHLMSDSTRGVVNPVAHQATAPDIVCRPNRSSSFNSSTITSTAFVDYVTDLFNAFPTISQKSSDVLPLNADVALAPPISIVTTVDNLRDTLSLTQFKPYTPNAAASALTPNIQIMEQTASENCTMKFLKPPKRVSSPVMRPRGSIRRRYHAVFHHYGSSRLNAYSCVDDTDASRAGTPRDRGRKFDTEQESSSSSVGDESSKIEGQHVEFQLPRRNKISCIGTESGINDGGSDSVPPGCGWMQYLDEVSSSEADSVVEDDDKDCLTYNVKPRTKASDCLTFDSSSTSIRNSSGSRWREYTETASSYAGSVVRKPSKVVEFFICNLTKKKSLANPDQTRGEDGRAAANETIHTSTSTQLDARLMSPPKESFTPIWKDVPIMYFKNGVHWTVLRSDQVVSPIFAGSTSLTAYGLWFEHTRYTLVFKILRPQIYPFDNDYPFEIIFDRRYAEFRELFLELTKTYQDRIFSWPPFPKRTFFGRFDPAIVSSRMNAFSTLLNFIALHPTLFNSLAVLKFLGIDLRNEDSAISRERRASAALVELATSSTCHRNDGSPGRRSFSNPLH